MAVFEIDMYERRVVTSELKNFHIERRGQSLTLRMGDEFYMRPATSKKGTWRLVMDPHSTTRVFSIDDSEARDLRRHSMGVTDED